LKEKEMFKDLVEEVLLSETEILDIVNRISKEIINFYKEDKKVIVLVLMNGGFNFSEDLKKILPKKFIFQYLKVNSYKGDKSCGRVEIVDLKNDFKIFHNKKILILDDIYDKGYTLNAVINYLKYFFTIQVNTCVLIERENYHKENIKVDFVGEKINDERFLIGLMKKGKNMNTNINGLDISKILKIIKENQNISKLIKELNNYEDFLYLFDNSIYLKECINLSEMEKDFIYKKIIIEFLKKMTIEEYNEWYKKLVDYFKTYDDIYGKDELEKKIIIDLLSMERKDLLISILEYLEKNDVEK
jgi:hypoxanthine phosphoribosyltransferase